MQVANTLAYNDTAKITAVKSFIAQAPVLIPTRFVFVSQIQLKKIQQKFSWGLCYKTLRTCKLRKMGRLYNKLVFFNIVSHFHWPGQTI
jgi:hypothetical protein